MTHKQGDDLVARLRTHFDDCPERGGEKSLTRPLLTEAAATITTLRAELAEAREAIAHILDAYASDSGERAMANIARAYLERTKT